ncbi:MAG: Hpt domain-containing protein [Mesorhizobium sp.]
MAAPVDRALLDPDGLFPARLAADRAALAGHADALATLDAEARAGRLKDVATLAHRLGGAAGTFGYGAISSAALALEDVILERRPGEDRTAAHERVQRAIDALLRALDEGLAGS